MNTTLSDMKDSSDSDCNRLEWFVQTLLRNVLEAPVPIIVVISTKGFGAFSEGIP
jgi:hypothetical protein